jgi:GTP-binding protein YchF
MTSVGFIGMPGSGKTTIFSALTGHKVEPQYLGFDVKPHMAVVKIPDVRLDKVSELYKARRTVQNTIEFVDIPGFDPTGTERKLKNAMLEHFRRCDALALVVNLFDPAQAADSAGQMRALLDELVILGLITAESGAKRLEKAARMKASPDTEARYKALISVRNQLEAGVPVRRIELSSAETKLLNEYAFISQKPVIAIFNVRDGDIAKADSEIAGLDKALAVAVEEQLVTVRLSATLQQELSTLDAAEAAEYMEEFGVSELALAKLIHASFDSLGLLTFFTGSDKECRAWSLRRGANAQAAAGVIHSDMARGFIRAETVSYDDYVQYGGHAGAKAAGKVRLEGKEYVVADGDVLLIRFNV